MYSKAITAFLQVYWVKYRFCRYDNVNTVFSLFIIVYEWTKRTEQTPHTWKKSGRCIEEMRKISFILDWKWNRNKGLRCISPLPCAGVHAGAIQAPRLHGRRRGVSGKQMPDEPVKLKKAVPNGTAWREVLARLLFANRPCSTNENKPNWLYKSDDSYIHSLIVNANFHYSLIMETMSKNDILKLSVSERIRLVEDIWDSIREVPEAVELTEEEKEELDRRLEAYHNNPHAGSPWKTVKERIQHGA
jgi:putative addiction module component (TIGR02574 family)